jgi:type I restriction enzyme, R subunit
MKLQWDFSPNEIQAVKDVVETQSQRGMVKDRILRNDKGDPPQYNKATLWHTQMLALLTSVQRSGPGSPVSTFLGLTPFPVAWNTMAFCLTINIDIQAILDADSYYERVDLLKDVGEKVWKDTQTYEQFMGYVDAIVKQVDDIVPHKEASAFVPYKQLFATIARAANDATHIFQDDIQDVAKDIGDVLDDSVLTVNWAIRNDPLEKLYNLSKVDFEALKRRFEQGRKHTSVERLRTATNRHLQAMVERNQTRLSYLDKFNEMVEDYNAGAIGVDEIFSELLKIVDEIQVEEQRHLKEGLTEEELAVFDLLTRPKKTLSDRERIAIKDTVKTLLATLKTEKLKLDWRNSDVDRATVRVAIEDILDPVWGDMGLDDDVYAGKVADVYNHFNYAYRDGQNHIYRGVSYRGLG